MSESVLLHVDGAVATVTLNRPESMNALDLEMARLLPTAMERVAFSSRIRAIVLQGAGEVFMAGGDVKVFEEHLGHGTQDDLVEAVRGFQRTAKIMRRAPKPVVAKVRGVAAGGGLSLVLASDLAFAAEGTFFSVAYSQIGASPDGGLTYHLPRAVGHKRAMELILLSERIGAERAMELGVINRVLPAAELDDTVDGIAARLASGPTRAYGRSKALVNQAFARDASDQLEAELEAFVDGFVGSPDFAEGVHAFVAKRDPHFRGK